MKEKEGDMPEENQAGKNDEQAAPENIAKQNEPDV
jgi:hypothetical protein